MATQTAVPGVDLKPYEDAIAAKIRAANARIDQFEAASKATRANAEISALDALKTARAGIERKVTELQTLKAAHVAQAKAEIDAAVVKLEKALEDFRAKYTTAAGKGH